MQSGELVCDSPANSLKEKPVPQLKKNRSGLNLSFEDDTSNKSPREMPESSVKRVRSGLNLSSEDTAPNDASKEKPVPQLKQSRSGLNLSFDDRSSVEEVVEDSDGLSLGDHEDSAESSSSGPGRAHGKRRPQKKFVIDDRTILIGNVGEGHVSTILHAVFEARLSIGQHHVAKDKPQSFYLSFPKAEEVEQAVSIIEQLDVNGHKFSVEVCYSEAAPATPAPLQPNPVIVIKNLAFNLKHEKLIDIMTRMEVPPAQLHYHYDAQGTFRGMAFAKYKAVEEAVKAFDVLQGQEIAGRKLRLEYRKKGGGGGGGGTKDASDSRSTSRRSSVAEPFEIDLNDEETRKAFDQLLKFKDNAKVETLSFPATLNANDRARVGAIADKLELLHSIQQAGDNKVVCVAKKKRHMTEVDTKPANANKQAPKNRRHTEHVEAQQRDTGRRNTDIADQQDKHGRQPSGQSARPRRMTERSEHSDSSRNRPVSPGGRPRRLTECSDTPSDTSSSRRMTDYEARDRDMEPQAPVQQSRRKTEYEPRGPSQPAQAAPPNNRQRSEREVRGPHYAAQGAPHRRVTEFHANSSNHSQSPGADRRVTEFQSGTHSSSHSNSPHGQQPGRRNGDSEHPNATNTGGYKTWSAVPTKEKDITMPPSVPSSQEDSSILSTSPVDSTKLSPGSHNRRKSDAGLQAPVMQGTRVPKGPDGSKGFFAGRGKMLTHAPSPHESLP
uniref:RRM domain-containing protein n=1 Tax=Cyanoptyche gloeocystis TaxID=77922 RepID=A0A7S2JKX1_9EUKA|mmetsp:Transcript_1645/g.3144  ORF Transcript_1645/g.3144 Transcript_1645/m.3144 type:complete len:721 (+) Transcript_1645:137-2299(+)|eukprot:CAMPEP_0196653148 /NCGR_PEP_ID=MMETSP1086-20130531/2745_1 /TAXON_ID=77921 /ORGANISM="Cyanoptyche  gloeocystis , Strain SAG4.97" /LENGTH=720 /DNA_ID=CAMNT_0041984191 /DNA_START=135 /DNA_END=2297 /DNA_ORIENTATION=-